MIYRKVYVSRAIPTIGEAEVQSILEVSRKSNQLSGLSGLLMFHEGKFFQVLEGPLKELEECYTRIEADERHHAVRLLVKGTSPDRAFPDWKMGFMDPDQLSTQSQSSVCDLTALADSGFDGRGNNERVHGLIDNFLLGFGIRGNRTHAAE